MIRFLLVCITVIGFLILSIPILIVEWIIGKFNPYKKDIIAVEFLRRAPRHILNIVRRVLPERLEGVLALGVLGEQLQRNIREKILTYFDMLSKRSVRKSFTLPYSYTDLADYLSIDRSAMMRELKLLIDEGFVKKSGSKITLLY